ncbi:Hypothetical protein LUCI_2726 [Lucifera butyrica]|uniref:Uncharacterized protein n=1 Tax=Lucifera butyrica TaxID=1351585 RepID=A0A498R950_9FIRM|nr:RNA-binding S4 domain-containing protein [Lucifera butyrica]VBB07477.1 Hypothetical protein LUCI_2726 [Lucifera butyrica]
MEEIAIHTATIQLDQLLKWAGIVETGGQVKTFLDEKLIMVNGSLITERRKKVQPGDVITVRGVGTWKVTAE